MAVQNVKYTLEFSLLLGHFHLRAQKSRDLQDKKHFLEFSTVFCHFLYRAPDCNQMVAFCDCFFLPVRLNFVSNHTSMTTTLTHLISAAISVAYENINSKRNKTSETVLRAVQRRLFISWDQRSANKLLRAQNRFTQEAVLISCYCTVLQDPVRST